MRFGLPAAVPAIIVLPILAISGQPRGDMQSVAGPPSEAGRSMSVAASVDRLERELALMVAEDGNEARYRVREQLARVEFPSDAVGVTSAVSGSIVLADDGSIVRDQSKFVVDITGLKSDNDRRDGYIQRRTLETEQYPTVEFVPTSFSGLASPPPASGEFTLKVTGDMTVHGVTKPITWDVTATAASGTYRGKATTAFTFEDFGMTKPRVAMVLSVVDTIRLEYDFKLVTRH